MRTVVIRVPRVELAAQMAIICKWLAKHGYNPSLFTSKRYENLVTINVQFENDSEADAFKTRFKAEEARSESNAVPLLRNEWQWSLRFDDDLPTQARGTMEQACCWRLRAEEVRAQAEALSSAEARDTMKRVAETWDQMAEDLERRLTRNGQ